MILLFFSFSNITCHFREINVAAVITEERMNDCAGPESTTVFAYALAFGLKLAFSLSSQEMSRCGFYGGWLV